MKNENGLYKFDIQLFAGTAFVESDVLPATTDLKISYDVSEVETYVSGLSQGGSDNYEFVLGDSDTKSIIYVSGSSSGPAYWSNLTVNGTVIGAWGDLQTGWVGTYGSNGYITINTSAWDLNDRTLSTVDTSALSTMGFTYEDLNATSTFTVSFDSNGGTSVSDIEDVEDGATITAPTAPTRENYTFAGWYKEEALTNAWVFASDTVTADTTLYAKWVQGAFEKMQEFGRQIVERVNGKASKYPPTNTQDANYTLVLADDGKLILAGHATNAVKVTIPLNATVEFPTNTEIAIVKYLAGDVTIGTASGATLNGEASTTTFEITDQYGSVAIKKIGTDAWIMTGAFEEVV